MTRKTNQFESLDQLIKVLEDIIIAGPDNEILSLVADSQRASNDVRRLIDSKMADFGKLQKTSPLARPLHPGKKIEKNRGFQSGKAVSRLALLRSLAMTTPELAPRAVSMFSGKTKPTSKEIDELTKEMVLLGLLSEDDLRNK